MSRTPWCADVAAVELQRPPLVTHPLFRRCSREEMRRISRWGDEVTIAAGQVLLTENTIAHWFFVIVDGQVEVSREGRPVAVLGAGDHVGNDAILGFAPQPTTAVTATPCRVFVMGRRYLISLTYDLPGLQRGLWDDVDEVGLNPRLRELRAAGARAWAALSPADRAAASAPPAPAPWLQRRNARRRAAVQEAFLALAAGALDRRRRATTPVAPARRRIDVRVWLAVLAVTAAVSLAVALVWHPPVALVVPGDPVDVVGDISIAGRPTHEVSGAYVMATVEFRRPTLAGLVVARVRGQRTVELDDLAADPERSRRLGREAFARARRRAVAAAARAAGIDPADLDVRFRDRAVSGSSAALVYALAIVDLLDPEDRARGRTIAATGGLTDDGDVVPIDYAGEKRRVARASGADVFLVPPGQRLRSVGGHLAVAAVGSLAEALRTLAEIP